MSFFDPCVECFFNLYTCFFSKIWTSWADGFHRSLTTLRSGSICQGLCGTKWMRIWDPKSLDACHLEAKSWRLLAVEQKHSENLCISWVSTTLGRYPSAGFWFKDRWGCFVSKAGILRFFWCISRAQWGPPYAWHIRCTRGVFFKVRSFYLMCDVYTWCKQHRFFGHFSMYKHSMVKLHPSPRWRCYLILKDWIVFTKISWEILNFKDLGYSHGSFHLASVYWERSCTFRWWNQLADAVDGLPKQLLTQELLALQKDATWQKSDPTTISSTVKKLNICRKPC